MEIIFRTWCLLLFLSFVAGSKIIRSVDSSPNERILNYIEQHGNYSADPCEDFQNYASGRFADLHTDDGHLFMQDHIWSQYIVKLQRLFDLLKDRVFIDENSVEEKVWRFYNTCLTAPNNTRSLRHYLELASPSKNLTWPQFAPFGTLWPKHQFNWMETAAHLERYGSNIFIKLSIEPNERNLESLVATVRYPLGGNMNDVAQVKDLLISIGVRSGRASLLVNSIIKLNSDLQELIKEDHLRDYSRRDIGRGSDHPVEYDDYDSLDSYRQREVQRVPSIYSYLEMVLDPSVDLNEVLTIIDPNYFDSLKRVIEKYDEEVVASYLMVRFSLFVQDLDGSHLNSSSSDCAATVAGQMELASDLLYKNYYLGQEKLKKYTEEVQQIFEAVFRSLMVRLEENKLHFDDDTISQFQRKLFAMTIRVGKLPNNLNHRRFVTKFYDNLSLDADLDFAKAQLNVLKHRTQRYLDQFKGVVSKDTYLFLPEDKNPEPKLHFPQSVIVLPYAMLQEPFFDPQSHDVFKVSLLGFSLARQVMSILHPIKKTTDTKYIYNGLACLNQTTESKDLQLRLDDVASLGLVYDAYFGDKSEFSQTQPAFTNLPLKKLFFINFAQMFVGDEVYVDFGSFDSDKLRLSEAVKNLPAFGEVFNCPTTALLNPPEKCEIF
ncbi:neprilysin-1-like [Drosophila suzukii]|uniref:Neprilysin-1-like n=1 Tax=Drosophila suzukii TaxID=28584 RepID=A0ABM4TUT2_DROSZ